MRRNQNAAKEATASIAAECSVNGILDLDMLKHYAMQSARKLHSENDFKSLDEMALGFYNGFLADIEKHKI